MEENLEFLPNLLQEKTSNYRIGDIAHNTDEIWEAQLRRDQKIR